jgi:hypothetical protein
MILGAGVVADVVNKAASTVEEEFDDDGRESQLYWLQRVG